jgi:Leucine-rich repeat (LRR) protein
MFRAAIAALAVASLGVAAQADRDVAQWTLVNGGRIGIQGGPATDQLPAGVAFELTLVDWVGVNAVPEDLARLAGLTKLRELRLPGPIWNRNADGGKDLSGEMRHLAKLGTLERITFSDHFLDNIRFRDSGLIAIGGLDNLRELSLRQAQIRGPGLKPFTLLESLDITLCPVKDEGFATVANMKQLRRLWAANTLITSASLEKVSGLARLEDLDLSGTDIDDAGVAHLASLRQLRRLQLASTNITDNALDTIASLPALEELNLYRTKVTNAGLARLKKLAKLRDVDVRYTRATAAGVAELNAGGRIRVAFSAPPATRAVPAPGKDVAVWIKRIGGTISADGSAVSLRGTAVSDQNLVALGALGGVVRKLDVSGTGIGDDGMAAFTRLPQLEELDLTGTTITDRGLGQLKVPGLRRLILNNTYVEGTGLAASESLEELDLLGSPVSDAGLETIARSAPGLRRLHLGETDVTSAGLAALASLGKLQHLDLAATDIGDEGLKRLSKLSSLRFLRLRETRLSDAGLAYIAPLSSLEYLDLGRTRISNVGLPALAQLKALRTLVIEYAEVDDAGLAPLAALTALRELNLDSTHVTDQAVAQLGAYSALAKVNLYHTLVTAEGVGRLKKSRPSCQVVWDPESSLNNRRRA